MKIEDCLKTFGINGYQGKVYCCLVGHGKLKPFDISKLSGVPAGKMYLVLSDLLGKGLIRKITNADGSKATQWKILELKEEAKKYGLRLRISRAKSLRIFYEPEDFENYADEKIMRLELMKKQLVKYFGSLKNGNNKVW